MNDYSCTYPFESKRPWLSPWHPSISKEITLYFRGDQRLCRSLEMIAVKKAQPVSSTIAAIVEEYVRSHEESERLKEKRRYGRKSLSVPAMLTNVDSSSPEALEGLVLDVSLGGLCVSVPDGSRLADGASGEATRFRATFVIPDGGGPVTMMCERRWSMASNGNVHVGASFVDGNFREYRTLQEFLMQ